MCPFCCGVCEYTYIACVFSIHTGYVTGQRQTNSIDLVNLTQVIVARSSCVSGQRCWKRSISICICHLSGQQSMLRRDVRLDQVIYQIK